MTNGFFITFEGTEGGGKTTQLNLLGERLRGLGHKCRLLREPGGTPIGEEIRYTLKHSPQNRAMSPETELLLMNASRAQLVRDVIRPALVAGEIILCDRFYDSTVAYQGYGRQLDLDLIRRLTEFAVGPTRPDLTICLIVPVELSEARRRSRKDGEPNRRDRFEDDSDRSFFQRVEQGYGAISEAEPARVRVIDARADIGSVEKEIWRLVSGHFPGFCNASAGK
jgi:dTMP kinase